MATEKNSRSSLRSGMSIVLLFAIGCQNKNEDKIIASVKETSYKLVISEKNKISDTIINSKDFEEFKKKVIDEGDSYSFSRLSIFYIERSNYKELHKYSLIMANKYNRGDGCRQAFEDIVAMNNDNSYIDITDLAKINEKSKSDALKYLQKGVKLNDINSTSMLQEIYRNGIGIKKDVKKADELNKKIEKM